MSARFTRLQLALLGGAALIVLAAVAATTLLTPPRTDTELRTLDEAVAIGILDQQVLDDVRASGKGRAMIHLDVPRILALAGDLGPTVPERLAEMRTVLAEHKQAILNAIGPGLGVIREYEYVGAFVAEIRSDATLLSLLTLPFVRNISVEEFDELDEPVAATSGFTPSAGSPIFQGAGVVVGVLDTGLDTSLDPSYFPAGSIAGEFDAGADDGMRDDSQSKHGTHVSSTVLLVAPRTSVYAVDVFQYVDDPNDNSTKKFHWAVDRVAGVDEMLAIAATGVNVRAINLSLGSGHFEPGTCPEGNDNFHFYEAYTADIIPVVSAGNDAYAEDEAGNRTGPYLPGLGRPGCSAYALSVGALTTGGCAGNDSTNEVWEWSQSSADLGVLAPGVCVRAATGVKSGTSMAAPQVTGAVAILASAKPGATNGEIIAAITKSGPPVFDPKSGITKRRLDIPAAIAYLLGQAPPITVPQPERAIRLGPEDVTLEEELSPGGTYDLPRFGIRNAGAASGAYRLEVHKPDLVLARTAPASWFTLNPASVTLQPGDRRFVTTTVRVPTDAAPGEYAALIVPVDPLTGEVIGDEAGVNAVRVLFTVSEADVIATVTDLLLGPVGILLVVGAVAVIWLQRRPKRS
jgi:subtilisin family serine protease